MTSLIKNIEILSLVMILVSNFLLMPGFLCGNIVLRKNENAIKFFAIFTVIMSFLMLLYIAGFFLFAAENILTGRISTGAIALIFPAMPFVIGYFASYEKVNRYTVIQIFTLILSLLFITGYIQKGLSL